MTGWVVFLTKEQLGRSDDQVELRSRVGGVWMLGGMLR